MIYLFAEEVEERKKDKDLSNSLFCIDDGDEPMYTTVDSPEKPEELYVSDDEQSAKEPTQKLQSWTSKFCWRFN